MCELLGMTANVPTDICFSFNGLMQRGGKTGPHKDGFGITFYEGKGCRNFKDANPSCDSFIADLICQYPIKSRTIVSHIRQANRGRICLENTHPFIRNLWGRAWSFAHNGQLSKYKTALKPKYHLPVGNTDSELAFCWILDQLLDHFGREKPSNMKSVFKYAATLCDQLRSFGIYNMLLTDGELLLSYCTSKLYWITRKSPFGTANLIDADVSIDFKHETTPDDIVTVIATNPLTDNEQWHKMDTGEYKLFKFGVLV
ncbi:MAG: class II glutamine amidotransferase [Pseudomonadota bacterium]